MSSSGLPLSPLVTRHGPRIRTPAFHLPFTPDCLRRRPAQPVGPLLAPGDQRHLCPGHTVGGILCLHPCPRPLWPNSRDRRRRRLRLRPFPGLRRVLPGQFVRILCLGLSAPRPVGRSPLVSPGGAPFPPAGISQPGRIHPHPQPLRFPVRPAPSRVRAPGSLPGPRLARDRPGGTGGIAGAGPVYLLLAARPGRARLRADGPAAGHVGFRLPQQFYQSAPTPGPSPRRGPLPHQRLASQGAGASPGAHRATGAGSLAAAGPPNPLPSRFAPGSHRGLCPPHPAHLPPAVGSPATVALHPIPVALPRPGRLLRRPPRRYHLSRPTPHASRFMFPVSRFPFHVPCPHRPPHPRQPGVVLPSPLLPSGGHLHHRHDRLGTPDPHPGHHRQGGIPARVGSSHAPRPGPRRRLRHHGCADLSASPAAGKPARRRPHPARRLWPRERHHRTRGSDLFPRPLPGLLLPRLARYRGRQSCPHRPHRT